jgi:magnesium-protoporphyrin O-methyltransferase
MSCNCGLNEMFSDRVSKHDARKFQRRGLDMRARKLLRGLERRVQLKGRTTLEIGIGTGGFTIEMLERGAASAVGIDAVAGQLEQAHHLANERGLAERLQLKQADVTEIGDRLPAADVVVLDRVVCCYPDMHALLGTAAAHTRAALAMSYPRYAWYTRLWVVTANAGLRLMRRSFRLHLHSPAAMQRLLQDNGLTPQVIGHRVVWELLIATRN